MISETMFAEISRTASTDDQSMINKYVFGTVVFKGVFQDIERKAYQPIVGFRGVFQGI